MAREMKNSGTSRIGIIPMNWEMRRLKHIAQLYTGNSIRDEEKELYEDPTDAVPYIASKDIDATFQTADYENGMYVKSADTAFKFAEAGSTLMCIEGGSAGRKKTRLSQRVAFVNKLCCFSPSGIDGGFLFHWICSPNFEDEFRQHITGLIGGVSVSIIQNFRISVPPMPEQIRIAALLNRRCAKIDSIIEATQRTIEEYKRLKQSIITEAVTHGVRPCRQMKYSGTEWIGTIPEDWEVLRKLSYAVNKGISYGIVKLFDPDDEHGVRVLRCSDVREGRIDIENIRTVTKEVSDEYSRTLLEGGEVLINVRGTLGGCAVVPPEMKGYNIAREVAMVSPGPQLYNSYLMYFFLSKTFITYEERHLAGSVYIGLNIEMLSACSVPLPSISEQIEIASYLDIKCSEIDRLIESKQHLLIQLEAYKKSVIYEYVTGKREVVG